MIILLILSVFLFQGEQSPKNSGKCFEVYMVNHGYHGGLVFYTEDLRNNDPILYGSFPDTRYLELGWGDSAYYTADEATFWLVYQALFKKTPSVIHVVGVDSDPSHYFSKQEITSISMSESQYLVLLDYVSDSFQRALDGKPIWVDEPYYGVGGFYLAKGQFSMFNTCNTWISNGLKKSNPNFKSGRVVTMWGLEGALEKWKYCE